MERLFVDVEIEINRTSTTTNKKSEKANHEFLHFSLFSLTLQSYTIKTAISSFYCIISPLPRKLGTNRAVGTSRSRYRAYRRHRWSRCLRICSSDKGGCSIDVFLRKPWHHKYTIAAIPNPWVVIK